MWMSVLVKCETYPTAMFHVISVILGDLFRALVALNKKSVDIKKPYQFHYTTLNLWLLWNAPIMQENCIYFFVQRLPGGVGGGP